jgi:hypothetical protein
MALALARRILLGALVAGGLACAAIAGEPEGDPFARILARHEGERRSLASAAPLVSRSLALADLEVLLERQASELGEYAAVAPVASAELALGRADEKRLEAVSILLETGAAPARLAALRVALAARGDEVEERAFALELDRALTRGQAETVAVVDSRIGQRAPGLSRDEKTRVVIVKLPWPEKRDEADARALREEFGARGLVTVFATFDRHHLGFRTPRVELILDRDLHVRGVDLVGDERRALIEELLK